MARAEFTSRFRRLVPGSGQLALQFTAHSIEVKDLAGTSHHPRCRRQGNEERRHLNLPALAYRKMLHVGFVESQQNGTK